VKKPKEQHSETNSYFSYEDIAVAFGFYYFILKKHFFYSAFISARFSNSANHFQGSILEAGRKKNQHHPSGVRFRGTP